MNDSMQAQASVPPILFVAAGEDRHGEQRGLGVSVITFKVTSQDSPDLLVLENFFTRKAVLHDTCTTIKMSGSTAWKASLSLKWE